MQESIRKYWEEVKEKEEKDELKEISKKLNQVYETISSLGKSENDEDKLSIDNLLKVVEVNNLTEIQERLSGILHTILIHEIFYDKSYKNIELESVPNNDQIQKWLDSLGEILKSFKWSEKIKLKDLLKYAEFPFVSVDFEYQIPYKDILDLYKFYESSKSDKIAFINRVRQALEDVVVNKENELDNNYEKEEDDFPF